MSDLVSVIIPAYNHEKYVQKSILSVVNQTYQNIELIIIDDGSTDSTAEKIMELEDICKKRFVNFEFHRQDNKGLSNTLNSFLKLAKGTYIIGTASDDVFKPNIVETLYSFLHCHDEYVMAVGDSEIIDANSSKISWGRHRIVLPYNDPNGFNTFKKFFGRTKDFSDDGFGTLKSLEKGNYIPNGQLIRKLAIDQVGGYNPDFLLEDYYMNLQLAKIGKLKFIDQILFSYRWHSSNTVQNLTKFLQIRHKVRMWMPGTRGRVIIGSVALRESGYIFTGLSIATEIPSIFF